MPDSGVSCRKRSSIGINWSCRGLQMEKWSIVRAADPLAVGNRAVDFAVTKSSFALQMSGSADIIHDLWAQGRFFSSSRPEPAGLALAGPRLLLAAAMDGA